MNRNEFVKKAELYVRGLYKTHASPVLVYHNLDHTKMVVKAALQIGGHYRLNEQENTAVLIAAWFHDTGYLFGCVDEHEEKSAELAASFLEGEKADPVLIKKVRECILGTKIFCCPSSLIAKIVADADLFHLGTSDFPKTNKRVLKEMKLCSGKEYSTEEWLRGALELLEKYEFHTDYCRNFLKEGKLKNIKYLRERLEKYNVKTSRQTNEV